MARRLTITLALLAVAGLLAWASQDNSNLLLHPDSPELHRQAPSTFQVRLNTSKGDIIIHCERTWAPNGVDRVYNLVSNGFYNDARFFRVVKNRWAQFGIPGDPQAAAVWRSQTIPDDSRVESNTRGAVSFAFAVPNGRTTQLYIALTDLSASQDNQGFVPVGRVVQGMDVADSLNSEYGETSGGGIRAAHQDPLFNGGNAYLMQNYPRLDYIRTASIVATRSDESH